MSFRCLTRRYSRTYVYSQSTGTLASPYASTAVLLAVHTGPGPSPKNQPTRLEKNKYESIRSPFETSEGKILEKSATTASATAVWR